MIELTRIYKRGNPVLVPVSQAAAYLELDGWSETADGAPAVQEVPAAEVVEEPAPDLFGDEVPKQNKAGKS